MEADTDGDGLTDSAEVARGTSPILSDTDGDGMDDGYEVTNGGFNPLIADLPTVSITVVDAPTIQIDTIRTDASQATEQFQASLERGTSTSFSRSDTHATSSTVQESARIYAEVETSAGLFRSGGSTRAGMEASVSASVTEESSTNVSATAATNSRSVSNNLRGAVSSLQNEVTGGSLRATIAVTNTSTLSLELSGVEVIAKRRTMAGGQATLQPIATLRFEPVTGGGSKIMAPGESIQKLVTATDPSVGLLEELMANPSGLLFSVSTYDMSRIGGTGGPLWPDVSQDVASKTAQVVVDYGANTFNGTDSVERYMVATNSVRDANGDPVGVTMARVMEVLGIPYETVAADVLDADHQPTGAQHQVLNRVRALSTQNTAQGFWYVFSSSASLDDRATDFGDIVLKARDRITLVFLADADGDRVFDREEYLLGTNPTLADTDGDGLSDFVETKDGWDVVVNGVARHVYSDPRTGDFDQDTLTDPQERAMGTDPDRADTDGDGDHDNLDPNPVGVEAIDNGVTIAGPGLVGPWGTTVSATGSISAPSDLLSVTIDWGDGTSHSLPVSGRTLQVSAPKTYAARGTYTVVVTASATGIAAESVTHTLRLPTRLTAALGQFTAAEGWSETVHTREVLDLDGDGDADLLGIGPGGVWVALSHGSGFALPTLATGEFDVGDASVTYVKSRWPIKHGDFTGDGKPDLVLFADANVSGLVAGYSVPGTYVAVNRGDGTFAPATLWSTDFAPASYPNDADYPRLVADFNGDGTADIVGFRGDGVRIGLASGGAFVSPSGSGVALAALGANAGAGGYSASYPRRVGDLNGDGFADLLGFGSSELIVFLNCLGPGPFGGASCPLVAGLSFANTATHTNWMTTSAGYDTAKHLRQVVDLDGDGDDDVVAFANGGLYFFASVGGRLTSTIANAMPLSPQFGYDDGWRIGSDPRFFADVSGDGAVDLVGIGPALGTGTDGGVLFAVNNKAVDTAILFGPQVQSNVPLWIPEFNAFDSVDGNPAHKWNETTYPRRLADVDGDGRADIVAFGAGQVIVEFSGGP